MCRKASALALLVAAFCFAADKKPPKPLRILTEEERQTAYNVAINRISVMLKAPSTAHASPIDQAVFSDGGGSGRWQNSIRVRLYVDAQNSYGEEEARACLHQHTILVVAQNACGCGKHNLQAVRQARHWEELLHPEAGGCDPEDIRQELQKAEDIRIAAREAWLNHQTTAHGV